MCRMDLPMPCLLPHVLEEYGESIHEKLKKLAVAAGIAANRDSCPQAAAAFIDAIKEMKRTFGIGNTVAEIQETDIPKLAHYADKEDESALSRCRS